MKVLLVFDQVEHVDYYMLDVTPEELVILERAHGNYGGTINLSEETELAIDFVNSALTKPQYDSYYDNGAEAWHAKWRKYQVEIRNKHDVDISDCERLIHTGFVP